MLPMIEDGIVHDNPSIRQSSHHQCVNHSIVPIAQVLGPHMHNARLARLKVFCEQIEATIEDRGLKTEPR